MESSELQSAVQLYMERASLSRTGVCKAIGGILSPAQLELWIRNKLAPQDLKVGLSLETVNAKLAAWLESQRVKDRIEARLSSLPDSVETPTLRRIQQGLATAKLLPTFFIADGGSGVGKTTAVQSFAADRHDTFVVTVSPTTAHLRECVAAIWKAIRCEYIGVVGTAEMSTRIIKKLEDTRSLLIFDEAQHLRFDALEEIRNIADLAHIGIALLGNEVVSNRMGMGERSPAFAQLRSRVGKRIQLTRSTTEDVIAVAEAYGVTGAAEQRALVEIASKDGALRAVSTILRKVIIEAEPGNISLDQIRAAWFELIGDLLQVPKASNSQVEPKKPAVARLGRAG